MVGLEQIEPPLPPFPPIGPPLGTNFSRLQETTPLPPFPARRVIFVESINILVPKKYPLSV